MPDEEEVGGGPAALGALARSGLFGVSSWQETKVEELGMESK